MRKQNFFFGIIFAIAIASMSWFVVKIIEANSGGKDTGAFIVISAIILFFVIVYGPMLCKKWYTACKWLTESLCSSCAMPESHPLRGKFEIAVAVSFFCLTSIVLIYITTTVGDTVMALYAGEKKEATSTNNETPTPSPEKKSENTPGATPQSSSTEEEQGSRNLIIKEGDTANIGGNEEEKTHVFDKIVLEKSATLFIDGSVSFICDTMTCGAGSRIEFVKKWEPSAENPTVPKDQIIDIFIRDAVTLGTLAVVTHAADAPQWDTPALSGGNGRDAKFGPFGRGAHDGQKGQDGQKGYRGQSSPKVKVVAGFSVDTTMKPISVPKPSIVIAGKGGAGGNGQQGGRGGNGGDASGDRTAGSGGQGGFGGEGGDGGNGATAEIIVCYIDRKGLSPIDELPDDLWSDIQFTSIAGVPGEGGLKGEGGAGGGSSIFHGGGHGPSDAGVENARSTPGKPGKAATGPIRRIIPAEEFHEYFASAEATSTTPAAISENEQPK